MRDRRMYLSLTGGGEHLLPEAHGLSAALVGSRVWLVESRAGVVIEFGVLDTPAPPGGLVSGESP
jgi:hypothetical protein